MRNKRTLRQTWTANGLSCAGSRGRARLSGGFALLGVCLAVGHANAAEYYVAPNGSDQNVGSVAQPFASLQKGHDVAVAGDIVWLRGGKYNSTKQIKLSKSGKSDALRIKFWAYQREVPIFDFAGYVSTNPSVDVPAVLVTGSWIHLKGLEIANIAVGQGGAHSISILRSEGASNNTFELLNLHHGFGPGLFISKGTGGNLILNCDSHDNYDKDGSQGDGQNGDGFGIHYQASGPSTVVRGCRAWLNSDDGYDLISQEVPVTIENSWAVSNGYANGGSTSPTSGNGNGFKAGSSQTGVRHILQNDVAWKNKAAGFYANHSSGGNTWLNNTAYLNSVQYDMLASPPGNPDATITLTGARVHKLRNNIGFPNKNTNMVGVDSMFNTWDLAITETSSDFVSTMDTGYAGPRQADGTLPVLGFLKLAARSPLIDRGTDVNLPYLGSAPDLGAYEDGAGQGGTAGAGGSSGSPGNAGNTASAGSGGSSTASGGSTANAGAAPGSEIGGTAGSQAGAGVTAGGGGGIASAGRTSSGAAGGTVDAGGTASGMGGGTGAAHSTSVQDANGCACATGPNTRHGRSGFLMLIGALALLSGRRRRTRN